MGKPKGGMGVEARGILRNCPVPGRRGVFLTIDDGPGYNASHQWNVVASDELRSSVTLQDERRFLDALDHVGAKLTVFFTGANAARLPDVVREYAARGHTVCSHGHSHKNLSNISFEDGRADLQQAHVALRQALGRDVDCFRAPFFQLPGPLRLFAQSHLGYKVFGASEDTEDWKFSKATECYPNCYAGERRLEDSPVWQRAEEELGHGEVILLHDRPESLLELPKAIQKLRKRCPECEFLNLESHWQHCKPQ